MTSAADQKIMGDAYRFVKQFTKTVKQILPKVNLKAKPENTIFYSPNYKTLYDEFFKEVSLEILNTAEMVLSNFDYQTIDLVDSVSPATYQNTDGSFSINFRDVPPTVIASTDSSTANMIYAINDTTVRDIDDKLNNPLSDVYSDVLNYFGKHSSSGTFVKYLPKYDEDGKPYYDLQIPTVDISGVLGYNIYMVEEDDIA
jgi:hypothetical protein